MRQPGSCPLCGHAHLEHMDVLWDKLIHDWQLNQEEVAYINRQQGLHCVACKNNLRSMALGAAIMRDQGYDGIFSNFCLERNLKILEINPAGGLTQFLHKMSGHRLIEYPAFDMQNLALPEEEFDLVIHSDTLEHVPNPVLGLEECRRVMRSQGSCIFTVPLIVNRLTRSRAGLPLSHHGNSKDLDNDQVVHSEFGADMWTFVLRAGFKVCSVYALEYPSAIVLIAKR